MTELCYFLTALKANYQHLEYHNYGHALSHAQSMYWILRKTPGVFTELEISDLVDNTLDFLPVNTNCDTGHT
ncbi:PDEase domain-containing protein [Caerostris darwini]|uniref:PDEase domain-containing protein n=2 Tax=Caerostris darwini TaxID=1538125 RepID=A0AAV4QXR9_9ARAC|nr:PDEase domain-containing protein [Caerostris darwini]